MIQNPNTTEAARQIVFDVLAMRPPTPGKAFRMYGVDPETILGAQRVELARRYSHMVPAGIDAATLPQVVAALAAALPSSMEAALGRVQTVTHAPVMRS